MWSEIDVAVEIPSKKKGQIDEVRSADMKDSKDGKSQEVYVCV